MTELDNYSLKGEISLITGASRGIGASIADLFGQSDSLVIGTATTPEGAQSISDRFEKLQIKGRGVVLDVSESCLLYTSPSPRDRTRSRMPSSA